jgi:hypothetical protein
LSAVVDLSDKEALGVYLLLLERPALDGTLARLRKRIEDRYLKTLTVEEHRDLGALYRSLTEGDLEG